ncbi:hypothetical protein [uncultured Rikenella sp.]|uniref:hypothetical protein n=1 Tax=uncultured Rikenella sp. TaxID=368003 RepID=UPI002602A408|nr:hypothetical protein [uncultured Rikenella sp.]
MFSATLAPPRVNPAPGYREIANGMLVNNGNYGYSWSSTVSEIRGRDLDFGATWLYPDYANSRGFGFQLHCLSE